MDAKWRVWLRKVQQAAADDLSLDAATGIWSITRPGDLSGAYYRFGVRVFVRGVGVVRNLVPDPYSLSLCGNRRRSCVADLNSERFKPAGWDASRRPDRCAPAARV